MKRSGWAGPVRVTGDGAGLVSQAGGWLLVEAARRIGLAEAVSAGLSGWRRARAVHDPGKTVLDLAIMLAWGGDCVADLGMLRAAPRVFGQVASEPTVSRLMDLLASNVDVVVTALRAARARVRAWVWLRGGAPRQAGLVVIDIDSTLIESHSVKEWAAKTWKKGFGFHPLLAWVDHGQAGTGEPVAMLLRPGNRGANAAADHIEVLGQALTQLPARLAEPDDAGRRAILIRTDGAGASQEFVWHIARAGMQFSVGARLGGGSGLDIADILPRIPDCAWLPAHHLDRRTGNINPHEGAWVVDATAFAAELGKWPPGTRLILRKERPHPGAQLRTTDLDGLRITGLLTNTPRLRPADLELRHHRHARVEDRIRAAKDIGLGNLPYQAAAHNQLWLEISALAQDLLAWTQTLALRGPARCWEPKTLRLRLFSIAGRLVTTSRRTLLRLAQHWPWTPLATRAARHLATL